MEKKKKKIPTVTLGVDDIFRNVRAISLVTEGAIELDWIALSKEQKNSDVKLLLADLNDEKRVITGAVLVPDKEIIRVDEEGNPFYITFTKETVEKASQLYLMQNRNGEVTLQHEEDVSDVFLIESWVKVSEEDKSVALGLEAPIGTWFASMKVNNDEIWEQVKNQEVKAFSIEGLFITEKVDLSIKKTEISEEDKDQELIDKLKEILSEDYE